MIDVQRAFSEMDPRCRPCWEKYGRLCMLSRLTGTDEEKARSGPLPPFKARSRRCHFWKTMQEVHKRGVGSAAILIGLSALDLLTTYLGGIELESNPVGRHLIANYGFMGLVYGAVLVVAYFATSCALMRRMHHPKLEAMYRKFMVGIYVVVVAWNVRYLLLR